MIADLLESLKATHVIVVGSVLLVLLVILRSIRRARRRRKPPKLHPKLQKYAGVSPELARERRLQAEKIISTSSTERVAGYDIVQQVEAVFVEGFRTPEEAIEGLKASASLKGANAVINLRYDRTAAGRCSASGDAVVVKRKTDQPEG